MIDQVYDHIIFLKEWYGSYNHDQYDDVLRIFNSTSVLMLALKCVNFTDFPFWMKQMADIQFDERY